MNFQELKSSYLKETVPLKKIQIIESVALHFENGGLEFLLSQYKSESDGKVRKKIIDVAGKNINDISIQLLIRALTDNNIESKKASVIALGKAKASIALIPLLNMLQNPSLEIKDIVLASIIRIGKEGDLDIIFDYIHKGNIHIKRSIPYILGKIGSGECIEKLKELITHEDPLIRKNSIKGLEKLLALKDAKVILNALSDEDLLVKKTAIRALGTIKSKRAIPHLIKFLKEKNSEIRKLSVRTLFLILSNQPPYDKIYEILNQRNIISRREAIKLLSLLEDKQLKSLRV
jgi:HEAT repeat protein